MVFWKRELRELEASGHRFEDIFRIFSTEFTDTPFSLQFTAGQTQRMSYAELTPGAQVRVRRSGYYHHGIYIGNGEIVHFDGSPNEQDAAAVRVRRTGMEEFLRGGLPELRIYGRAERKMLRAPDEIAAAALSAVGRGGYDYRTNNCEHFSNECAFGEHYSRQSGEGNE